MCYVMLCVQYFGQNIEVFFLKKLRFSVYLVEMDTDPDRQSLGVDPDSAE